MNVRLPLPALNALSRLAVRERRDARDQAALLIEAALESEGLLAGVRPATRGTKRARNAKEETKR